MSNNTLSKEELFTAITLISREGPEYAANHFGVELEALKSLLEASFSAISAPLLPLTKDRGKKGKPRSLKFAWVKWATLDPDYIPPVFLMHTLNTLLSAYLVKLGLTISNICPLDDEDDLFLFFEAISNKAEAACTRELEMTNDGHKVCHIVSLSTSFNITLLHILNSALAILSGKVSKRTAIKADTNLCGLVSAPIGLLDDAPNTGFHTITALKHIKRHGNVVSPKEIADMSRSSVSFIADTLKRIETAIDDCRLAAALDLAADVGLDVNALLPRKDIPPTINPDLWYNEKEALKFLGIDTWMCLPEKYQPSWVIHADKHIFHEEELIRVQELMEQDGFEIPEVVTNIGTVFA